MKSNKSLDEVKSKRNIHRGTFFFRWSEISFEIILEAFMPFVARKNALSRFFPGVMRRVKKKNDERKHSANI